MSREILEDIISDFQPKKFIRFFRERCRSSAPLREDLTYYDSMAIYDAKGLLTLDTVMNTIITNSRFSPYYILAILNSRLAEWFYYWFVYNRAIRTMHFDGYYIGKLPIKNIDPNDQRSIIELATNILTIKKQNPQADTSQWEHEIDHLVYGLYGLGDKEIGIVGGK